MARLSLAWRALPHPVRWVVVALVGVSLLLAGLLMLVLPGPGIPVLLLGLAVLASEFAWAEVTLRRVHGHGSRMTGWVRGLLSRRGDGDRLPVSTDARQSPVGIAKGGVDQG